MIKTIKNFFANLFKEDDWSDIPTCKYCGWPYKICSEEKEPTCIAYSIFKLEERLKKLEGEK